MERVVDLQAQILPGLGGAQGPQTVTEAMERVRTLVEMGMTDIFAAPYVSEVDTDRVLETISSKTEELRNRLNDSGLQVTIYAGSVVILSDNMLELIKHDKERFCLGNSHFISVFIPAETKIHHAEAWLTTLQEWGLTPVVCEAERYEQVFKQPERLLQWVDRGILIQCNMASFADGSRVGVHAHELYKNGLVHFFGTGSCDIGTFIKYQDFMSLISELDYTYKKDVLSEVQMNERDLLADRLFYPSVPSRWKGTKRGFWSRLLSFSI